MQFSELTAICPLDGRYVDKLTSLRAIFSEFGLIHYRLIIEIRWIMALADHPEIKEVPHFNAKTIAYLEKMMNEFSLEDATEIKRIENTTNHDVKAVEYFLQRKFEQHDILKTIKSFIHFACTSEDINNLAYSLMLKSARDDILLPASARVIDKIMSLAKKYSRVAMLSRTHGQPATPTTLGKEFLNTAMRLKQQYKVMNAIKLQGKINGAVGNFNAHLVAYPDINWLSFTKNFVNQMGLRWNEFTTQIEPHDYIAELLHALSRFNTILIDFDRDVWGYISLKFFTQKKVAQEVGSSTMPHKVNPIDFENSEGNLGLANAISQHLANKLPISRWQRDLSDSTVLRNLGLSFGYSFLAYQSTLKGLDKLIANEEKISKDLHDHWEVLAEAVQTVMRRYGIEDAYEQLKEFTRGKSIDEKLIKEFIGQLELADEVKSALLKLTPENYIGLASELAVKSGP